MTKSIRELEVKRDQRSNEIYQEIDKVEAKKTESWKKNAVQNSARGFFGGVDGKLAELEALRTKLRAIAQAFDLQVKALQTVGGLLRTETDALMQEARVME